MYLRDRHPAIMEAEIKGIIDLYIIRGTHVVIPACAGITVKYINIATSIPVETALSSIM